MKSKSIKIKIMTGILLASMAISSNNIAFAANTVSGTTNRSFATNTLNGTNNFETKLVALVTALTPK